MELLSRQLRALVLASALLASSLSAQTAHAAPSEENWATARARSLTEQGRSHRAKGDVGAAVTRFNEALSIDATFGDAYLELAKLREASGEIQEAEHVLAMALERIPGFVEGLSARGELYERAKRNEEAVTAFLEVLGEKPDDEPTLRKILENAARARLFPVALSAARRLRALADARGDAAAAKDARLTARALMNLVGEVDPVAAGTALKNPIRRALAAAR